ncbi:hypothetical protein AURDEDRAFT_184724 [Auricularia subglabra TFB-10046 SS5]|nr:hypothetical protein AURDEDRAFT_184724 [Auricularia subglabra TFB-10046 SS5]
MNGAPSVSTLLLSLQTHMTNQISLLPTLHAQLGLPASALSDELEALRRALVQAVEKQVDGRKDEVERWMARCAGIEEDCAKLARALGGHGRAVGVSVGELRKQQVIPKRHELLTAHQEKLVHLYNARLEQLHSATARIVSLSNTLGPSFYPRDVLEPTPATDDPDGWRDVTPERFNRLEKELVRGKTEIGRRLSHLASTLEQVTWLHTELGIPLPELDDCDLTRTTYAHVRPTSLSSDDPFATPQGEDITGHARVFAQYVARLEEAENESLAVDSETLGVEGVEPTVDLLAWTDRLKADLDDLKAQREASIQALYDTLEALWKRLSVDEDAIDEFVEAHRGSTLETVQAYEDELERMLELKRERMSVFVENARQEIHALWDDLMCGPDDGEFAGMQDDEHTEELLMLHEEEIARLKDERRTKAPLLAAVRRWLAICDEERELAASASDQSRLLGRGPRDPGRLLREEKMRKRVQKEKPRLEQELRSAIPAWEREQGRAFCVRGMRALDMIEESAAEKENKKRPNKPNVVPARATTPQPVQNINGKRTTPTTRSASTASYAQAPPSKRAKLTPQTLSASQARPPLSAHNGQSGLKPPSTGKAHLPKPTSASHLPMPSARLGASHQQAALGLGHPKHKPGSGVRERVPSNVSTGSTRGLYARLSDRARRESFRPRASVDGWAESVGILTREQGKWTGWPVLEEEEDAC